MTLLNRYNRGASQRNETKSHNALCDRNLGTIWDQINHEIHARTLVILSAIKKYGFCRDTIRQAVFADVETRVMNNII